MKQRTQELICTCTIIQQHWYGNTTYRINELLKQESAY